MAEAEAVPAAPVEQTNYLVNGLKQINLSGKVAKGIKCVTKAIMKKKAILVLLADDTDNKDYKNLVSALCKKYGIKLVNVPKKAELGQACGMDNIRSNGTVRKAIGCGAVAIIKYGKIETPDTEGFRAAYDPKQ